MSTLAQVSIGLLLLLAGVISIVAAVLGNPIRIGAAAIPGPDGKQARAAVAGIGSVALAACAVVFILGGAQQSAAAGSDADAHPTPTATDGLSQAQALSASDSGSVGGLPSLLPPTPTPTGSPKPPPAPSTAPPIPGKPTVTSISVAKGTVTSGCALPVHGSVTLANEPVTLTYVISVDGHVVGANPRTLTATGSIATLDDWTVDARHAGEIVYNILTPNLLSDLKTWTVPTGCQPGASILTASAAFTGSCAEGHIDVIGSVTVNTPPGGLDLGVQLISSQGEPAPAGQVVHGETGVAKTIFGRVNLPADLTSDFVVTVSFKIYAPIAATSGSTSVPVHCEPPPPPPPPPSPSDSPSDPPTTDPTTDPPPSDEIPVDTP